MRKPTPVTMASMIAVRWSTVKAKLTVKPEMLIRSVNEAALFRYLLKPVAFAELVKVVGEAVRAAG